MDSRRVLDAIRRIVAVLRAWAAASERRLGISGAQLFVLQTLAARPAGSLNEIAARTLTHQSSVSVVARKLAERKLVARRRAAGDGRRRELAVTARGRSLLRRAVPAPQERLIAGVRALSAARRRQLAASLEALLAAMGAGGLPAGMFFEPARARRGRHA